MVRFEWHDEKKKKTTRLIKEDKKKDKIKYILIGIVIGIPIGIVIFYILVSSGIIRPFLKGFMRPGNFTRPRGFTRPD